MAPRCEPSRLVHVPSAATGAWTTRSLVNVTPPHRDDRSGVWHSQHGQDRVVSTLLASKHGGYFIDLAASEPLMHSPTREPSSATLAGTAFASRPIRATGTASPRGVRAARWWARQSQRGARSSGFMHTVRFPGWAG